ncbi:16737_t:CDS:2, partial [Entrophospora sp. SA101]
KTNDKYLHAIGDVPTRWSNYNRLNKILLEEDEWDFMLEMINILGPFYKSTLMLGASNYVTISLMYPVIEALKEKFKVDEYCDEPILESSETVFDEIEVEEDNDDDNNSNGNSSKDKSKKKKININKPQDMYRLADQVRYNLHKYLNFYWPNLPVEELVACVLDPRVKKLNFITSKKREEVFDILKKIYLEMCPEQSPTADTNQSTTDSRIKSKKVYQLSLMKTIYGKTKEKNLNEMN